MNWNAGVSLLLKAGLLKCALNEICSAAKQGYTSMKRHGEACQSQSRLRCCYCWAIRALLINSAANHCSPCFRPANLDFITGTYGTSTVHYCSAPAPWPSGNLIPARRQVNWDCLKIAALSLSCGCAQQDAQVCAAVPMRGSMCFVSPGMWMWFLCSCWKLAEFVLCRECEMFKQKYAAYLKIHSKSEISRDSSPRN